MKTLTPKDAGRRHSRLIGLDRDGTVPETKRPVAAEVGGSRRLKTTEGARDTQGLSRCAMKEALTA